MKNLFEKLCAKVKFNTDNMVETLKQKFLIVDDTAENYWLCICRREKLIEYLSGDDIIQSDCRLFVHLCSLVLSNSDSIIFQMPRNLKGVELLIPKNVFYLYPDSPYRNALGASQGQFLIKHCNRYYGLTNTGVLSHTINQWKKLYLEKITQICSDFDGKMSIQMVKCQLLHCQLRCKKIHFKLTDFNSLLTNHVKKFKRYNNVKKFKRFNHIKKFKRFNHIKKLRRINHVKRRNNCQQRSLRY